MRSARLELALASGALVLPALGNIVVMRPRAGDDLSMLPQDQVVVQTGFKPDYDYFAAQGYRTGPAEAAVAIVCVPRAKAEARWDLARFDADVRQSQACRWVVYEALRNGSYYPWDYQPLQKASERYMRNHMDLNILEENQRFPRGE